MSSNFLLKITSEHSFKKSYYSVFFEAEFFISRYQPSQTTLTTKFDEDYLKVNEAVASIKNNQLEEAHKQLLGISDSFKDHLFVKGLRFLLTESHHDMPTYAIFNKNAFQYLELYYRDFIQKTLLWTNRYFSYQDYVLNQDDDQHRQSIIENSMLLAFLGEISLYRFITLFKNSASEKDTGNAFLMGTCLISCAELMTSNQPKINYGIFSERPLGELAEPVKETFEKHITNKKEMLMTSYLYFNERTNLDWRNPYHFLVYIYETIINHALQQLDALFIQGPEVWRKAEYTKLNVCMIKTIDLMTRLLEISSSQVYPELEDLYLRFIKKLKRYLNNVILFNNRRGRRMLQDYFKKNDAASFKKLIKSEKIVKEFFAKLF